MPRARLSALVLAAALATGCGGEQRPEPPRQAARPLPDGAVRYVHRTFHRLDRRCAGRDTATMAARFVSLYRRYPPEAYRLRLHDEGGSMLSAVLVLRDTLRRCRPRDAAPLDAVLPEGIRAALRPLPAGGN